ITAPRPARTVDRSIHELRQAGFMQDIQLFAEPGATVEPQPGLHVHINTERKGLWRNWLQAPTYMSAHGPAPFILICEDDIRLSTYASLALQHAIDTFPQSTWGYASLFTPRHNLSYNGHPSRIGWQVLDLGRRSWGALAYCFSRESLEQL